MGRLKRLTLQLITVLIGLPILAVGLILIPLPGPGLLVCFLALFILSLGFEWPKRHLEKVKLVLRKIYDVAKERAEKIENRDKH